MVCFFNQNLSCKFITYKNQRGRQPKDFRRF